MRTVVWLLGQGFLIRYFEVPNAWWYITSSVIISFGFIAADIYELTKQN